MIMFLNNKTLSSGASLGLAGYTLKHTARRTGRQGSATGSGSGSGSGSSSASASAEGSLSGSGDCHHANSAMSYNKLLGNHTMCAIGMFIYLKIHEYV
jgi:hypothetical protein